MCDCVDPGVRVIAESSDLVPPPPQTATHKDLQQATCFTPLFAGEGDRGRGLAEQVSSHAIGIAETQIAGQNTSSRVRPSPAAVPLPLTPSPNSFATNPSAIGSFTRE